MATLFGIPAVVIFGLLAWFSWRRGHRHGLVLLWGVLFGCFLGAGIQTAVHSVGNGMVRGVDQGAHGALSGVSASLK